MKEIDLRPDWYRTSRRRKRNVMIRVTLLGILAVELILGSVGILVQKAAARQEMVELRSGFERQTEVLQDLDGLLLQLDGLRKRRELLSDVAGGAPVHCLLAELSRLMPESTVLTEVRLAQQRRIGDANVVEKDGSEHSELSEGEGAGRLEIKGWASSDVNVGVFMSNVAESALFRDVTLTYSQPVVVKGHAAREFKLTCVFPQFE